MSSPSATDIAIALAPWVVVAALLIMGAVPLMHVAGPSAQDIAAAIPPCTCVCPTAQ